MANRLWIVPDNDLESKEIQRLLVAQNEKFLTTGLAWGATWAKLEPSVVQEIQDHHTADQKNVVYGIELGGPNPFRAINIDHHQYSWEDRSHLESSLEQVAGILKVRLSREQLLIAANDREWIPGMEDLNATPEEIDSIRRRDRRAQGVTEDDERRALAELSKSEDRSGLFIIDTGQRPISAHLDFAYLQKDAREILVRSPEQWLYSGRKHRILASLRLGLEYWSGGGFASGYFGVTKPDSEAQQKILEVLEPPGREPTQVEHMDIVLIWPFRMQPFGDLKEARDDSSQAPQKWLEKYSGWICTENTPKVWKDRTDEKRDLTNREVYSEFVYFHPFVQDLLFPRPRRDPKTESGPMMRVLERSDIQGLHLDVKYDRDCTIPIDLPVDDVRLHLLITDIGILTVRLRVPRELALNRALDC
jgi:hypothetical protein